MKTVRKSDRLLYVASSEADFHASSSQLSGDTIGVLGGHHNSDVAADAARTCPEIRLQRMRNDS